MINHKTFKIHKKTVQTQQNGFSPWKTTKQEEQQASMEARQIRDIGQIFDSVIISPSSNLNSSCNYQHYQDCFSKKIHLISINKNLENSQQIIQDVKNRLFTFQQNYKTGRPLQLTTNRRYDNYSTFKNKKAKFLPTQVQLRIKNVTINQSQRKSKNETNCYFNKRKQSPFIIKQKFAQIRKKTMNSFHKIVYNKENSNLFRLPTYQ